MTLQPSGEVDIKALAQQIDIERVKAHLYLRTNLREDLIPGLNNLFLIENMRAFWQQAHLTGWLHRYRALEPMYNACQAFWYAHHERFGHAEYMDVMRWKPTKKLISFDEFREQMQRSYKKSHGQQMRRWREKYKDKIDELERLRPLNN